MSGQQRRYISYLLRLWQIGSGGELVWRASLESPHTGEHRGFANLADLFTFLEKEIGQVARSRTAPNAGEKGSSPHENPKSETYCKATAAVGRGAPAPPV